MTQLDSAVVLITGAAGGFGTELTRQLLLKGSRLVLSDRPGESLPVQAEQLQKSLGKVPGEVVTCIEADLSTREGCNALYGATQTLEQPIDVLINNAGMALLGNMVEIPPERWEQLMQVNLLTPMWLSTQFAADMVKRRQGHIVNMSSLAGWIAIPGLVAYAASKHGLRGFSEGLRHEVVAYNVKVTTVYPFFSRTPILQSPRFGTFAETNPQLSPTLTTDPARVMARTIRAIERNQTEVFPDTFARVGHLGKRYFPALASWLSQRLDNGEKASRVTKS
jgi:short-subunit dehydrogenase